MRLVLAVDNREVKTALFLALSGVEAIEIVATANTTAELITFARAFRPDVAIVESGLPGSDLAETVRQLGQTIPEARVLLIDGASAFDRARLLGSVEVFKEIDDLVAALPGSPSQAAS